MSTKLIAAMTLSGLAAFFIHVACAQDEAIPKPKPKAAPAVTRPAAKPAEKVAPVAGATLLVMCDLACSWKLDGNSRGNLAADSSATVQVALGQHIVAATTQDGRDRFEMELALKNNEQAIVRIQLEPARAKRTQRDQEVERVAWRDPANGLMWTKSDNGDKNDLTWQEAVDYCKGLQLAGYADWRLPTIDELNGIYDPTVSIPFHCCDNRQWKDQAGTGLSGVWHVKGGLRLTGGHWSSSPGNASGEAWDFYFVNGKRYSTPLGRSSNGRALCVRRPGK